MSSSTDSPPLSSICRICNISKPRYTCPRCSLKTCSLPCIKRHKLWYQCSGVRDAAAFVPLKELYTISGINNDYNFITSIERGMERADRIVIHEKGLIPKRSERTGFKGSRKFKKRQIKNQDVFEPDMKRIRQTSNAHRLENAYQRSCVIVEKAPAGMQRSKDNLSKVAMTRKGPRKLIWQVEWITDDGKNTLRKLSESSPLGQGYAQIMEELSKEQSQATHDEPALGQDRKRELSDVTRISKERKREDRAKRLRIDRFVRSKPIQASSYLQNPKTARWSIPSSRDIPPGLFIKLPEEEPLYHFYLLRPFTPASLPKVLIPLDVNQSLKALLQHQVVLEFPTIYVSRNPPAKMPKCFMMEKAYLNDKRRGVRKNTEKPGNGLDYSDSESESESESEAEVQGKSDSDSDPNSGSDSHSTSAYEDKSDGDSSSDSSSDPDPGEDDDDEDAGMLAWSDSSSENSDDEKHHDGHTRNDDRMMLDT